MLVMVTPAYAETRQSGVTPRLSFNGTTVTCAATILADKADDEISAVMTLWQGDNSIETWEKSGTAMVVFHESMSVKSGTHYTLTVKYSINGKTYPEVSTSRTCP